jgi:hypothetical protein
MASKNASCLGLFGAARFLASQSAFDTLVGDRETRAAEERADLNAYLVKMVRKGKP